MATASSCSLFDFLQDEVKDGSPVRDIIRAIADSCADIAVLARGGGAKQAGTENEFGDAQLEIDLAAEKAIIKRLSQVQHIAVIASEEHPEEKVYHENGTHSVTFDPLDGSSIVACNWAVGSIVCDFSFYIFDLHN